MKKTKILSLLTCILIGFSACSDDPAVTPTNTSNLSFDKGIYLINEGNFGVGNASIDFYLKDSNKVYKNVFQSVNNRPLGDVAQSMTIVGTKGFIVMNGSGKVEIIDVNTVLSLGTITGLSAPRYIVARNSSIAYLSDWISNTVKIIDATNNSITNAIGVGTGPEGMTISGEKLFVTNSGGYALDSTISVIDMNSNTVVQTIVVGDAPVAAATDVNGKVWVLCEGDYGDFMDMTDDTKPKLVRINPNNFSIEFEVEIGNVGDHPDKMKINKDKNTLFYLGSYDFNSGLFKYNINDLSPANTPLISGYFYGFGYDKILDQLYLADPIDFVQNGYMYKYQSNGVKLDSMTVGIIPNGIHE
jgi:YVTN family beta-propeller protein